MPVLGEPVSRPVEIKQSTPVGADPYVSAGVFGKVIHFVKGPPRSAGAPHSQETSNLDLAGMVVTDARYERDCPHNAVGVAVDSHNAVLADGTIIVLVMEQVED